LVIGGLNTSANVYLILFLASIAVSAVLAYRLYRKKTLEVGVRRWIIFGFLASMVLISGAASGNVVTIVFGASLLFATAFSFLTSYVKSDLVKRTLGVVFFFATFFVMVYGYAITRSLILLIALLFIATMLSVAFVLSYLLPGIRKNPRGMAKG